MRTELLWLSIAGCCPQPQMEILQGSAEVAAGEVVQLQASHGSWRAGPDDCGAHWYVDLVEGGSPETGTIDDCGLYQAPAAWPEGLQQIPIEASLYERGGCADCCPYAAIELLPI